MSVPITPLSTSPQQLAPNTNPRSSVSPSFALAVGKVLITDADYATYIDPQITGPDRTLAIHFMRLMPANMRGDFVYVSGPGRVLSNHRAFAAKIHFAVRQGSQNGSRVPRQFDAAYPCPASVTGPYIRQCSAEGVTAAYGYVTPYCGNTLLQSGDAGELYLGGFGNSGGGIDAGLAYNSDNYINPYVRTSNAGYIYSGWTNEGVAYQCGQHLGMMYGILNSQTAVFMTGIPDEDPTQFYLPPSLVNLSNAAWNFFVPPSDFNNPGTWHGNPTPCTNCTAKRMTSIAFGNGNDLGNDTSCFGACSGAGTIEWDQVVMGQLIQPCSQNPGNSATCTIQYFPDGSWEGLIQQYPSAYVSGVYYQAGNYNQFVEGINLGSAFQLRKKKVTQGLPFHAYRTPPPKPPPCQGLMPQHGSSPGGPCPQSKKGESGQICC